MSEQYDPDSGNVQAVNDYLADADAAEVQRVLEAERNGQARKGILEGPHVPKAPAEDTVPVKLRHHWTDASGTSHTPGAELTVARHVAEQLVAARFATSDAVASPNPTPAADTDTGMTGEATVTVDGTAV